MTKSSSTELCLIAPIKYWKIERIYTTTKYRRDRVTRIWNIVVITQSRLPITFNYMAVYFILPPDWCNAPLHFMAMIHIFCKLRIKYHLTIDRPKLDFEECIWYGVIRLGPKNPKRVTSIFYLPTSNR